MSDVFSRQLMVLMSWALFISRKIGIFEVLNLIVLLGFFRFISITKKLIEIVMRIILLEESFSGLANFYIELDNT